MTLSIMPFQAFANWMHGYNRACNMHANSITRAKNLYTVLIPLCKNNLNLPVFYFFLSCASLSCPFIYHVVMLATLLCCTVFFYLLSQFCSPAINQISCGQLKGWFPFILLCTQERYHWTGLLGWHINYTNTISKLYQHMYSYTSCKSQELWKMSNVLSTCYNWELLITCPHRLLSFERIRTTTTIVFLISTICSANSANRVTNSIFCSLIL